MASRFTHNVCFGKKYQSQGQEKTRWLTVGSAFTGDDGNISIKLDCVPVGGNGDVWLKLFPPKENER